MDNSLLNQILHEYELKRNKAELEAKQRKKRITFCKSKTFRN